MEKTIKKDRCAMLTGLSNEVNEARRCLSLADPSKTAGHPDVEIVDADYCSFGPSG